MAETIEQKPIELTLGDGTVVKGASLEDAFNNLKKIAEDRGSSYRSAKEEAERYEREARQRETELEEFRRPKPKDGEFDNQKYYKLLNEDPIAAQNYMDAYRFGTPDPVQAFSDMRQKVESMHGQALAASFQAMHPEFPAGRDAAKVMRERVETLTSDGYPFAIDTLELAYNQLVKEEKIKPATNSEPEVTPNPSLSAGSGAVTQDAVTAELDKIAQMDDRQLEAYLKSKGMFK